MRDAFALAILQGFGEREVSFHVSVGREVVRPFIPLLADRFGRNKLGDFNVARRLRLKDFQFLIGQITNLPGSIS